MHFKPLTLLYNQLRMCHKSTKTLTKKCSPLFGLLSMESPIDTSISALSVEEHPEMNRLNVELRSKKNDSLELENLNAKITENKSRTDLAEYQIDKATDVSNGKLRIFHSLIGVPLKYDIGVTLLPPASLTITGMMSQRIAVHHEESKCLKDFRTDLVDLKCEEVNVTGAKDICCRKIVSALLNMNSLGNGSISCSNIRSTDARLITQDGSINIDTIYSDKTEVRTRNGHITLKNPHRQLGLSVERKGNVRIDGLDGAIEASINEGDCFIQIERLENDSRLVVAKGNVEVVVPGTFDFRIVLASESNAIDINGEVKQLSKLKTEGGQTEVVSNYVSENGSELDLKVLKIECSGNIRMRYGNWATGLNSLRGD